MFARRDPPGGQVESENICAFRRWKQFPYQLVRIIFIDRLTSTFVLTPIELPGQLGRIIWKAILLFWFFIVFKLLLRFAFFISFRSGQGICATIGCQKFGGWKQKQKCHKMHTCNWLVYKSTHIWSIYLCAFLENTRWIVLKKSGSKLRMIDSSWIMTLQQKLFRSTEQCTIIGRNTRFNGA
jgi:hypothetical protein